MRVIDTKQNPDGSILYRASITIGPHKEYQIFETEDQADAWATEREARLFKFFGLSGDDDPNIPEYDQERWNNLMMALRRDVPVTTYGRGSRYGYHSVLNQWGENTHSKRQTREAGQAGKKVAFVELTVLFMIAPLPIMPIAILIGYPFGWLAIISYVSIPVGLGFLLIASIPTLTRLLTGKRAEGDIKYLNAFNLVLLAVVVPIALVITLNLVDDVYPFCHELEKPLENPSCRLLNTMTNVFGDMIWFGVLGGFSFVLILILVKTLQKYF